MNPTAEITDEVLGQQVRDLVDDLQRAWSQSQPAIAFQKCVALSSQLLLRRQEGDLKRKVPSSGRLALAPWQERKAKALMARNLASTIRINDIATQCSLSRSHFSRAFKQNNGCSPQDWLLRMRVGRAMRLLTDPGLSIAQIAQECGFADQSHLTRSFSRMVGATPFAWRRQHCDRE